MARYIHVWVKYDIQQCLEAKTAYLLALMTHRDCKSCALPRNSTKKNLSWLGHRVGHFLGYHELRKKYSRLILNVSPWLRQYHCGIVHIYIIYKIEIILDNLIYICWKFRIRYCSLELQIRCVRNLGNVHDVVFYKIKMLLRSFSYM